MDEDLYVYYVIVLI